MTDVNFDEEAAEGDPRQSDLRAGRNAAAGMDARRMRVEARGRERSDGESKWTWLETLGQDLRYGIRKLAADPAFTLASLVSLAIGIGANTAVFSVLNAVMLRTLPVEDPRALVSVAAKQNSMFTNAMWERIRDRQDLFAGSLAFGGAQFNLADGGEAQYARGLWVSGDYFRVLGVAPMRGR